MDWSQTSLGEVETWSVSLRLTFNIMLNACNPMLLVWGDDRLLLYNPAYCQFDQALSLGQPMVTGLADEVQADINYVFATGQSVRREHQQWFSDQPETTSPDFTWSYSPICEAPGQVVGILVTGCPNLNDRKPVALQHAYAASEQQATQLEQANAALQNTLEELQVIEEELRQQNDELAMIRSLTEFERQRYQDLFDCAPDGYVVTDAKGMIHEANQAIAALLGVEQHGMVNTLLIRYIAKPDRPAFKDLLYELRQSQLPKLRTDALSFHSAQSRPIPAAITGTVIYNADAQIVGFRWLIQDITDRKQAEAALRQSEERYRYLAELIPQLVWTANSAGVLLDVNQRWADFTGLTLAQAQRQGWEAVVHPEDVSRLTELWISAQQKGIRYQAEGRMRRADGVYRWHLHQAVPLTDEQGQVIKWFGTATDIEEHKQLERQREQILLHEQTARAEAERVNRIKDEFLAVLSHELRSPLNPILGWAKLLQQGKLDATRTAAALATIERNAKLQAQLIDDLLDVSRILQGKLVLNSLPVDLSAVLGAAIDTVRLAIEAKAIQLHVIAPGAGSVLGDAARLQQVIWNLLSNAVKFTPRGGQITVELTQVGTTAQIRVNDTGKGIHPHFLPHVFEHFRQEDGATTRQFGGLGLGLAIVRQIVELHGGSVGAASPGEGQGATFTVRLPLWCGNSLPDETGLDASPLASHSSSLPLAGLRLLIVDDEADMRELAQYMLKQQGAEVSTAASAQEALRVLEHFTPDVLISDIGMPEMDGYMLMQQVRSRTQDRLIPAIALTAYAGELDHKQAIAAGFQQHIPKPVEPDLLVQAIARLKQNQ